MKNKYLCLMALLPLTLTGCSSGIGEKAFKKAAADQEQKDYKTFKLTTHSGNSLTGETYDSVYTLSINDEGNYVLHESYYNLFYARLSDTELTLDQGERTQTRTTMELIKSYNQSLFAYVGYRATEFYRYHYPTYFDYDDGDAKVSYYKNGNTLSAKGHKTLIRGVDKEGFECATYGTVNWAKSNLKSWQYFVHYSYNAEVEFDAYGNLTKAEENVRVYDSRTENYHNISQMANVSYTY